MGANNSSTSSDKSENNNTQVPKNGFEEVKNYLMQYGYKHTKSSDNITYEYDKHISNATVTLIYKEKTDTILMRYDPDYVAGYDIANVIVEISRNSNSADLSMVIYPSNVIKSYSPEISIKKSEFTKNMSIRFNDTSIPQSIRQSVDEFASKNAVVLLNTVNEILSGASVTIRDLGFVNF